MYPYRRTTDDDDGDRQTHHCNTSATVLVRSANYKQTHRGNSRHSSAALTDRLELIPQIAVQVRYYQRTFKAFVPQ